MKTNEKFDGIITFGIDCDEVLRSLLDGMVSLYNENFGESMTRDEVKDFDVDVSFPKVMEFTGETASKWFFQEHSHELFLKSPALPGMKKAIETLQKYGQVIIVTYQKSFQNKLDTLNWLNDNGIHPDGLCFLKNKTLLHLDWMIDDNDWNLVGCNAENAVLITAPYNKDIDVHELKDKTNSDNIYRFGSLEEFADWYELSERLFSITPYSL
jgi:5'(3')-deoxyribonucleotidase